MGIRGLSSFLKEKGLLASFSSETGETFCALNDRVIEKGSTFAVDGSGLVSYKLLL